MLFLFSSSSGTQGLSLASHIHSTEQKSGQLPLHVVPPATISSSSSSSVVGGEPSMASISALMVGLQPSTGRQDSDDDYDEES